MKAKTYSTKVRIAEFLEHRKFLEAVVEDLRTQGVFSHRVFNRDCGFASPNFVQLVIQGKRNLSEDAAVQIAKTLALSKQDTRLFLKMRALNQTQDPAVRVALLQDLLKQPGFTERHELSQTELSLYTRWYNVIVRELLQSHPQLSAAQIGEALLPKVSETEIQTALDEMTALGFLKRESRAWVVEHPQINTRNEVVSQAISSFHASMINLGRESLARFRGDQREVSSITLQLTETEFLDLRERIRDFKREALTLEKSSAESRVYQFNFQLFPVTSPVTAKETES